MASRYVVVTSQHFPANNDREESVEVVALDGVSGKNVADMGILGGTYHPVASCLACVLNSPALSEYHIVGEHAGMLILEHRPHGR